MSLQLLTAKVLSDIRIIRPETEAHYASFFSGLLANEYHVSDGYTLTYTASTNCYDLCVRERGQPVGGIRAASIDAFRVRFIKDFLFPNWRKDELEAAIAAMYPILGQSEAFAAFVHHCEIMPRKPAPLGTFDFSTMTFSGNQP